MMAFPLTELMDEQACYEFLVRVLHPKGLRCPAGHRVAVGQAPHMRDRAPVVDYRCRQCGKVFNVFTNKHLLERDTLFVSPSGTPGARVCAGSANVTSG
jgi:transposase-like protein